MEPYWSPDQGAGNDEVVQVELTHQSFALANQYIHTSRPQGTQVMFQQLDDILWGQGSMEEEDLWTEPPSTTDTAEDICPLASEAWTEIAVGCQDMVTAATELATNAASPLQASLRQQITATHSGQLRGDELNFVSGWAQQAVNSGVKTGSIQAVGLMRELQICDTAPDPKQRAFLLGERQARDLVAETEAEVLPTIPLTQCNTDSISATVLSATQTKIASTTLCSEQGADDVFAESAARTLNNQWARGMQKGFENAYELMRARLLNTWQCEPPPAPEPPPPAPEAPSVPGVEPEVDACICYARYSGEGPVFCFRQSDHPAEFGWPQWGGDLADLAERVPQCTPDCKGDACGTPRPIGSPLVVDLDGDGIQIDPHRTLAFDLADTGELVRVG
ncbi:MAG: hypothetical protein AAFS10_20425, partial [Myxococcota bacterium]